MKKQRPEATIMNRFKSILVELLAADEAYIRPETRLREDLEMDDLDLVEFIMAVEEEWGLEIPDSDIAEGAADTKGGKWRVRSASPGFLLENLKLRTVQDWVAYLMRLLDS